MGNPAKNTSVCVGVGVGVGLSVGVKVAVREGVMLGSGVKVGLGASVGVLVGLGVAALQAENATFAHKNISTISFNLLTRYIFFIGIITPSLG